VHRDIVEYASLSQSVVQLTKIVSEGMTHVKRVPDAPGIATEMLQPMDAAPSPSRILKADEPGPIRLRSRAPDLIRGGARIDRMI